MRLNMLLQLLNLLGTHLLCLTHSARTSQRSCLLLLKLLRLRWLGGTSSRAVMSVISWWTYTHSTCCHGIISHSIRSWWWLRLLGAIEHIWAHSYRGWRTLRIKLGMVLVWRRILLGRAWVVKCGLNLPCIASWGFWIWSFSSRWSSLKKSVWSLLCHFFNTISHVSRSLGRIISHSNWCQDIWICPSNRWSLLSGWLCRFLGRGGWSCTQMAILWIFGKREDWCLSWVILAWLGRGRSLKANLRVHATSTTALYQIKNLLKMFTLNDFSRYIWASHS
jgi:hypothetical protein